MFVRWFGLVFTLSLSLYLEKLRSLGSKSESQSIECSLSVSLSVCVCYISYTRFSPVQSPLFSSIFSLSHYELHSMKFVVCASKMKENGREFSSSISNKKYCSNILVYTVCSLSLSTSEPVLVPQIRGIFCELCLSLNQVS